VVLTACEGQAELSPRRWWSRLSTQQPKLPDYLLNAFDGASSIPQSGLLR